MLNFRKVPTSDLIGKGKILTSPCRRSDLEKVATYAAAEDADIALAAGANAAGKQGLAEIPLALKNYAMKSKRPLSKCLRRNGSQRNCRRSRDSKSPKPCWASAVEELAASKSSNPPAWNLIPDSPKATAGSFIHASACRKSNAPKPARAPTSKFWKNFRRSMKRLPRPVLDYRSLVKLKNAYLDNLTDFVNKKTGRISRQL